MPFKIGKALGRDKISGKVDITFKPVKGRVVYHDSICIAEYEPMFTSPGAAGIGNSSCGMPTALQLSTMMWKPKDYSSDPGSRSGAYGMRIESAAIIIFLK